MRDERIAAEYALRHRTARAAAQKETTLRAAAKRDWAEIRQRCEHAT